MISKLKLDELAQRVAAMLPDGAQAFSEDVKKNLKAALEAGLAKLDLVTREEFDVQAALLARTRAKVDALEKQLGEMEKAWLNRERP